MLTAVILTAFVAQPPAEADLQTTDVAQVLQAASLAPLDVTALMKDDGAPADVRCCDTVNGRWYQDPYYMDEKICLTQRKDGAPDYTEIAKKRCRLRTVTPPDTFPVPPPHDPVPPPLIEENPKKPLPPFRCGGCEDVMRHPPLDQNLQAVGGFAMCNREPVDGSAFGDHSDKVWIQPSTTCPGLSFVSYVTTRGTLSEATKRELGEHRATYDRQGYDRYGGKLPARKGY